MPKLRTRRQRSRLHHKPTEDANNFIVDDEVAPPIIDDTINSSDCWVTAWEKLKASGWNWGAGKKS